MSRDEERYAAVENSIRAGARAWLRGDLDSFSLTPVARGQQRAAVGAWLAAGAALLLLVVAALFIVWVLDTA